MTNPSLRLPAETFVHVLSYLNPPALSRCAAVCKTWQEVCLSENLWRTLAVRLGYVVPAQQSGSGIYPVTGTLRLHTTLLSDPENDAVMLERAISRYRDRNLTDYFDDCTSYRSLCCKLWRLACNYTATSCFYDDSDEIDRPRELDARYLSCGRDETMCTEEQAFHSFRLACPTHRLISPKPEFSAAWRCKLDPVERTVITTGQSGGIEVIDHATQRLLWHIPKTATRPCPHLEFSNGWMIFDRPGLGHFEVWRSERLVPDLGRPADRGHYQRFCILATSRPIRAYRFQYPFLAGASQDGFIEIWNVPEQRLVETINIQLSAHRDGNITYIDFDDEYVFLTGLGAKSISVFSRESKQAVWSLSEHFASGGVPPATWRTDVNEAIRDSSFTGLCIHDPVMARCEVYKSEPNLWQAGPNTMNVAQLTMTPWQIWSAVHADVKTNTLLMLGQGTVVLLRDYKKFLRNPRTVPDLFVEIEFFNLQEYYAEEILQQDDPRELDFGWNGRRLWESVPEAQMTVHEGKAFIVNSEALVIDLAAVTPLTPPRTRSASCATTAPGQDTANKPASARWDESGEAVESDEAPLDEHATELGNGDEHAQDSNARSDQAERDLDEHGIAVWLGTMLMQEEQRRHLQSCSCVQMDETGVYYLTERMPDLHDGGRLNETVYRGIHHLDFTRPVRADDGDMGPDHPAPMPE